MILSFANLQLDTGRFELRRAGEPVPVEPLVFDLLLHLARNPNTLLTRDALLDSVWSGRLVSDSTISSAIKSARRAIGDSGTKQSLIKTVHGRGFMFCADVEESERAEIECARIDEVPLGDDQELPSLMILPFTCLPENKNIVNIARAMVLKLETVLTRIPLLTISSEGALYSNDLINPTPGRIFQQTGVRYVVDGTLERAGPDLNLNIQLVDAARGIRLWGQSFSAHENTGPPPVDQLISATIAKLEPQLNRAILDFVEQNSVDNSARGLFLRASGLLAVKGWHQDTFREASELLKQSQQLDSEFALPPAYRSLILAFGHRVGLLSDDAQIVEHAVIDAERAMVLDSGDSMVLGYCGCALADCGMLDRGVHVLNNAIEINPANGQAWVALGAAELARREPAAAVDKLLHGIEISPMDSRLSLWRSMLSMSYVFLKKFEHAAREAELACQHDDHNYMPRLALAVSRLMGSDTGGARQAYADALRIKPDLSNSEIDGLVSPRLRKVLIRAVNA